MKAASESISVICKCGFRIQMGFGLICAKAKAVWFRWPSGRGRGPILCLLVISPVITEPLFPRVPAALAFSSRPIEDFQRQGQMRQHYAFGEGEADPMSDKSLQWEVFDYEW